MGYMVHHAIIVTSEFEDAIEAAHGRAVELFENVSMIIPGTVNIQGSFFVPPDGSKEGWSVSCKGDHNREEFVEYLRGDSGLSWAEVQYGDQEGDNKILNSDADHFWREGLADYAQPVRVRRRMIDLG